AKENGGVRVVRAPQPRAPQTRRPRRPEAQTQDQRRIDMDLVIFDLDGTLIDSKLDLAHAVNATRAHMTMSPLDHERVYSYVGNGAPVLIRRAVAHVRINTFVIQRAH